MATPTPETAIWLALKARVVSLALTPDLPIAFPDGQEDAPGTAFTPPQDSAGKPTDYLDVRLLRNDPITFPGSVGGTNRHTGILQILLHARKDRDFSVATEICGDIAEHFKFTTPRIAMTSNGYTVFVERAPTVGNDISDTNEPLMQIPISIRWQCDVART